MGLEAILKDVSSGNRTVILMQLAIIESELAWRSNINNSYTFNVLPYYILYDYV